MRHNSFQASKHNKKKSDETRFSKKKKTNVVLKAFIVEQQSSENIKNELETKVEFLWNSTKS
jgi:hypothetical protein